MSVLVLIRHGQASLFEDDYDRLSELGREQSRRLAEHWRRRGISFDAAFTGPLERQRTTAREIRDALVESAVELDEPVVMSEWAEYDGALLTAAWQEEMAVREPDLSGDAGPPSTARARAFQRAFEAMMRRWVAGELVVEGAETWCEFQRRVWRGLEAVRDAHPRGARVAVFTSGGAIAVALQRVLGLSDMAALELNWAMRNCSVSEVLYTPDRMSLATFNCTAHLEADLLTYR